MIEAFGTILGTIMISGFLIMFSPVVAWFFLIFIGLIAEFIDRNYL